MSFGASTMVRMDEDRVMEGLRVPPELESVQTSNFVLTQEPGKLKPKDLKAAIERNRAEKEQRAEEQKKLREEGGGAGMLDLRGILAEERLNSSEGDPFKRQLREMAFLADVDDVEKMEIEKGFRISGDYLGSIMLSQEDIDIVYKQRRAALLHKKRTEWRVIQSRDHTGLFPPTHPHVKAGTAAETAKLILTTFQPHYDTNRNDIWAKRLNTLRRFISCASTWLIRKRVKERMDKVMALFNENGCFTREEIRAFIELPPSKQMNKKVGTAAASGSAEAEESTTKAVAQLDAVLDPDRPASVSVMVFAKPNESLTNRERNQQIIVAAAEKVQRGENEITPEMARRVLFPRCNPSHGGGDSREALPAVSAQALVCFDDRTFFQLKTRPEYSVLGYAAEPLPAAPVHFPACGDKRLRAGAAEEWALRPPADANSRVAGGLAEIDSWRPAEEVAEEPETLKRLRDASSQEEEQQQHEQQQDGGEAGLAIATAVEEENATASSSRGMDAKTQAIVEQMPKWLTEGQDVWDQVDLNFLVPVPQLRVHSGAGSAAGPRRCEFDHDWLLRPDAERLTYQRDSSLRSSWCSRAGFLSVNTYLLGAQESRNRDPPPPPGPTLSDYYLPDVDRHKSGLGCYRQDHLRGDAEWDADVRPLQQQQDKRDYLTDSESDCDDEGYGDLKPSVQRVRQLLQGPVPSIEEPAAATGKAAATAGGAKKGGAVAAPPPEDPVAAPPTSETFNTEFSALGEGQHREEQVELLRDRKTLDLESTLLRERKVKFNEFSERLSEVSSQSSCLLQALSVQVPFHMYEDDVYKIQEPRMPMLNPRHVEDGVHIGGTILGNSLDSMPNVSMNFSPSKPAL